MIFMMLGVAAAPVAAQTVPTIPQVRVPPSPPIAREQRGASPVRVSPAPIAVRSCTPVAQRSASQTEAQIADGEFTLGMQRLNADDPFCAIPLFDAVLAAFPFATHVFASRALAKAQLGDWEGAEADADRAISLDGSTSNAFDVRGIVAARRGDHLLAIAAFTRAIELFPSDRYAHRQRMRSYALTGQPDAAFADADWLITTDPTPHNIELATGIMADVGRTEEALDKVDHALSNANEAVRADLFCIKAHLLIRLHRNAAAVAAFTQAIEVKPSARIYLDRAEARAPIDRAEALKDVEAAHRLDPQSSDVVRIHAWLLSEAGEGAAALALIDQALSIKSGDIMLLGARSYTHEKLGQTDAMLDDLDAARRVHPDDMFAAEGSCLAKARSARRLDSARVDCDAAVSADPYRRQALDARGLMLLQTRRASEAARDYALASRIDPTDGDARFGYGVALLRLGATAAGNAELAAAKKLSAGVVERFAGFGIVVER